MLALTALPPLLAVGAYLTFGAPGLADQAFDTRVAAWMANPRSLDPPRMTAIIRYGLRSHPNDLVLLRSLAVYSLRSGDPATAVQAMHRAVAIAPSDPGLWVALGESISLENEGRLDADSRAAFAEALRLRPGYPEARYAIARGQIAGGDLAGGLAAWRALIADLPATDPERARLVAEADQVQQWGGLEPPRAAQAPQMSGAIRGMVEGLAQRLAAHPDDPQGWMRLVRAYTVLGDTARRDATLAQARARYHDRPDILRGLDEALRSPVP
jgi:cytochrome c-type biogenesis protein CcmH